MGRPSLDASHTSMMSGKDERLRPFLLVGARIIYSLNWNTFESEN